MSIVLVVGYQILFTTNCPLTIIGHPRPVIEDCFYFLSSFFLPFPFIFSFQSLSSSFSQRKNITNSLILGALTMKQNDIIVHVLAVGSIIGLRWKEKTKGGHSFVHAGCGFMIWSSFNENARRMWEMRNRKGEGELKKKKRKKLKRERWRLPASMTVNGVEGRR